MSKTNVAKKSNVAKSVAKSAAESATIEDEYVIDEGVDDGVIDPGMRKEFKKADKLHKDLQKSLEKLTTARSTYSTKLKRLIGASGIETANESVAMSYYELGVVLNSLEEKVAGGMMAKSAYDVYWQNELCISPNTYNRSRDIAYYLMKDEVKGLGLRQALRKVEEVKATQNNKDIKVIRLRKKAAQMTKSMNKLLAELRDMVEEDKIPKDDLTTIRAELNAIGLIL